MQGKRKAFCQRRNIGYRAEGSESNAAIEKRDDVQLAVESYVFHERSLAQGRHEVCSSKCHGRPRPLRTPAAADIANALFELYTPACQQCHLVARVSRFPYLVDDCSQIGERSRQPRIVRRTGGRLKQVARFAEFRPREEADGRFFVQGNTQTKSSNVDTMRRDGSPQVGCPERGTVVVENP